MGAQSFLDSDECNAHAYQNNRKYTWITRSPYTGALWRQCIVCKADDNGTLSSVDDYAIRLCDPVAPPPPPLPLLPPPHPPPPPPLIIGIGECALDQRLSCSEENRSLHYQFRDGNRTCVFTCITPNASYEIRGGRYWDYDEGQYLVTHPTRMRSVTSPGICVSNHWCSSLDDGSVNSTQSFLDSDDCNAYAYANNRKYTWLLYDGYRSTGAFYDRLCIVCEADDDGTPSKMSTVLGYEIQLCDPIVGSPPPPPSPAPPPPPSPPPPPPPHPPPDDTAVIVVASVGGLVAVGVVASGVAAYSGALLGSSSSTFSTLSPRTSRTPTLKRFPASFEVDMGRLKA